MRRTYWNANLALDVLVQRVSFPRVHLSPFGLFNGWLIDPGPASRYTVIVDFECSTLQILPLWSRS
jgi:hypothetical protein